MFEGYKRLTNSIVARVNRVRLPNKRTRDAIMPRETLAQFIAEVQYAASQAFVLVPLAEISQLSGNNRILAVSKGVRLTNVTADDIGIYVIHKNVSFTDVPPPLHFKFHERIYATTASKSVLLCHPLHAYKAWRTGKMPDLSLLPHFESLMGGMTVCEEDQLAEAAVSSQMVLVPSLGMFSHAATLFDAISQVKLLEWICASMDSP
jgi:ribulose-5-phosphate 4-epimerase/fuculose-1-phosphate aldolase